MREADKFVADLQSFRQLLHNAVFLATDGHGLTQIFYTFIHVEPCLSVARNHSRPSSSPRNRFINFDRAE